MVVAVVKSKQRSVSGTIVIIIVVVAVAAVAFPVENYIGYALAVKSGA